MPIYEFRCEPCGHRFEDLLGADSRPAACPRCGRDGARRVMSLPGKQPRLVMTPRSARRKEAEREVTHGGAKRRFAESRRRARESARGPKGRGGGEGG